MCTTLFGNSIPFSEFESVSFDFDSFNLKRRVLYTEWALIPACDSKFFRLSVMFIALILFTSATLIWRQSLLRQIWGTHRGVAEASSLSGFTI